MVVMAGLELSKQPLLHRHDAVSLKEQKWLLGTQPGIDVKLHSYPADAALIS